MHIDENMIDQLIVTMNVRSCTLLLIINVHLFDLLVFNKENNKELYKTLDKCFLCTQYLVKLDNPYNIDMLDQIIVHL